MHACVAIPLWEEEVGSGFVAISSLKTKDAVLVFDRGKVGGWDTASQQG